MSNWTSIRAKYAAACRDGADEKTLGELRRELRVARLSDAITATVEALPPLTDEQRAKLSALLSV